MLALITGASSGIGYEIAKELDKKGYSIIAIGRNKERLEKLKKECKNDVTIEVIDLANKENVELVVNKYINADIDILVNSAGIGAIGDFNEIKLNQELEMININIVALHILTKAFLDKMLKKNQGYILNISSSAAFSSGPLMTTYYATKSYVYRLSCGINKELKKQKKGVSVSVLCPGPVDTNFNNNLNIKFSVKPISAEYVAKYSIKKLFKKKQVIVPGIKNKCAVFFSKILPESILSSFIYNVQAKKMSS